MSPVAFIWHYTVNCNTHAESCRGIVNFDENMPVKELLKFLEIRGGGSFELVRPVSPQEDDTVPF